MTDEKRQRRQRELRRLDARLEKLYREHPIWHWLLAIGVALAVLTLAMLVRWLLEAR